MTYFELMLVSVSAAFAFTVWMILAVSAWRHGRRARALLKLVVAAANLVSVVVLYMNLTNIEYQLSPVATAAILIALIFGPAYLALVTWLTAVEALRKARQQASD